MTATAPPSIYIATATGYANSSPCQKSKRGAVIFDPAAFVDGQRYLPPPIGAGYNGMPRIATCDGSAACRRDCAKICEHAEARAVHQALLRVGTSRSGMSSVRDTPALAGLELVHVKTVEGRVVPGGPPSCWQCSKTIVGVGLDAVWLYENRVSGPEWIRYTADEFHDATLKHEKLHPYDVVRHDVRVRFENGLAVYTECSCGFKPKDDNEMALHVAATTNLSVTVSTSADPTAGTT